MYSGLKVLASMLVLITLITGCVDKLPERQESLQEVQAKSIETEVNVQEVPLQKINLQEVYCEQVEVFLGENIDVQYLIKVEPEWVEYWYETESIIDDIPWSKDYSCLPHALDSAKEWEQDFGNEGLYIAGSMSDFHSFNAVYTGGEILNLDNWTFIEPQDGKTVQLGSYCYSFPIDVNLQYISYEGIWGISPTVKIIWETNDSKGVLHKVDKAGNLMSQ